MPLNEHEQERSSKSRPIISHTNSVMARYKKRRSSGFSVCLYRVGVRVCLCVYVGWMCKTWCASVRRPVLALRPRAP